MTGFHIATTQLSDKTPLSISHADTDRQTDRGRGGARKGSTHGRVGVDKNLMRVAVVY